MCFSSATLQCNYWQYNVCTCHIIIYKKRSTSTLHCYTLHWVRENHSKNIGINASYTVANTARWIFYKYKNKIGFHENV